MNEEIQFIKWLFRKVWNSIVTGPIIFHDWLTEQLREEDMTAMKLSFIAMLIIGSALLGIATMLIFGLLFDIPKIGFNTGFTVGILFTVSVIIRALRQVFHMEREELINELKKDHR